MHTGAMVNHGATCWYVQRWQAFLSVALETQPITPHSMPPKHMYVAHTCECARMLTTPAIHRAPPPAQIQANTSL